jgi:hypothetical protein
MRRWVTAALLGALFAVTAAAGPAAACGCGALAPGTGGTVSVTSESAVITWIDGVQTIDLALGVDSAIAQAGLVVATPAPATVSAGDTALLASVEAASSPTPEYFDDWWGTAGGTAAAVVAPSPVKVGALETVTLAASDSAGLTAWLQANAYTMAPEEAAQLGGYAAMGWYLVAVKLAADPALDGQLEPIRLTFPTAAPVYPVGLSRGSTAGESLRLSMISDHRMDLVQSGTADVALNAAQRTVWAGPVTAGPLAGSYLTVSDVRFDQPALQVTGDIGFVAAANDDPVSSSAVVIRPVELLGFPLGTLLVTWGGIGLVILLGAAVARLRLR